MIWLIVITVVILIIMRKQSTKYEPLATDDPDALFGKVHIIDDELHELLAKRERVMKEIQERKRMIASFCEAEEKFLVTPAMPQLKDSHKNR
ncbi:MAG: hypothetical protein V1738_04595 [Patescibacteria group bacterium]